MSIEKRNKGQFYTVTNPFCLNQFFRWYNEIPNIENETILEPFAGSNNIINMIEIINLRQPKGWTSYDIEPPVINNSPDYKVNQRDTIKEFPTGYKIGITNPPYLAKNSATRRGLDFPDTEYDDLYKESLYQMLKNLEYVAAIIPESFLNADIFTERLDTVISLNLKMFEDTDCPVCLALFVPEETDDTDVYRMDLKLGTLSELEEELYIFDVGEEEDSSIWKFNSPDGDIGALLVDNTITESIHFVDGESIPSEKIKGTSRSITRISGHEFNDKEDLEHFLNIANELVHRYRDKTQDVFMTPFKGLRKDGKYRRRLDFKTTRLLLTKSFEIYRGGKDGICWFRERSI